MKIELDNVSKLYGGGTRALDGLSVAVGPGVTGLLGPNGAGKSTLIRLLVGLASPTTGMITFDGMPLAEGKACLYRRLGYLPQRFAPYPSLSVGEFLDYMALLKEIEPVDARRERIEGALAATHLGEHRRRRAGSLSGGLRQRLGIAQALLNDPDLLVLDEPTAGLDPEERLHFRSCLAALATGRSILISSHIVGDLAASCERLLILEGGRLLHEGSPEALCHRAKGRVWELELPQGGLDRVAREVRVIGSRSSGGRLLVRAIGEGLEAKGGRVVDEPTLEDGYLWLKAEVGR